MPHIPAIFVRSRVSEASLGLKSIYGYRFQSPCKSCRCKVLSLQSVRLQLQTRICSRKRALSATHFRFPDAKTGDRFEATKSTLVAKIKLPLILAAAKLRAMLQPQKRPAPSKPNVHTLFVGCSCRYLSLEKPDAVSSLQS